MARVVKKSSSYSHRPPMRYVDDNIEATKKGGEIDNLVARIIKRGDMDNLVARIIKKGGGDMDNLVARIIKNEIDSSTATTAGTWKPWRSLDRLERQDPKRQDPMTDIRMRRSGG